MFNFCCGCGHMNNCCNQNWECPCKREREEKRCGMNFCFNLNRCNRCCNHSSCHEDKQNSWGNECRQCHECRKCHECRQNSWEKEEKCQCSCKNDNRRQGFDNRGQSFDNFFPNDFDNFNRGGCQGVTPIFIERSRGSFGNGCEVLVLNPSITPVE